MCKCVPLELLIPSDHFFACVRHIIYSTEKNVLNFLEVINIEVKFGI